MKKRLIIFLVTILSLTGVLFASPLASAIRDTDTNSSLTVTPETTGNAEDNESNEGNSTESDSEENSEESNTCYDQLGGIGWLICPVTTALANGIDWLYSGISSFLEVKTISTETDSPIYLVWEYMRNITNIVFIIFILIIVYSQLTGFGISNYGIKRTLPRIIITAVLVNLSFIICALAVDVSNILGGSLHHVFVNIKDSVIANGGATNDFFNNLSVSEVVATLLGTAGVGTVGSVAGLAAVGGIGAAVWMLIPVIFSGIVAVLAAFITIAARQALIMLLIMIAPLAFVAYLLPNTEKWFNSWKNLLTRMLIFYPMFSVLFGASQLASWAIISSSTNWLGVILGIAVQILPLFMSFSLLKMSGTIPGKVGELFRKPFAPAQKGIGNWANDRAAARKAEHLSRGMQRKSLKLTPGNAISSSYWAARTNRSRLRTVDRQKAAETNASNLGDEYLNALKTGHNITGYDKNGTPIYSKKPVSANQHMKREFKQREISLRANNSKTSLDNTMGTMGDYLKNNQLDTSRGLAAQIKALTERQGQNFLDSVTLQKAAARNDMADKRFYHESVTEANKAGERSEAYERLIIRGAGADGLSDDKKIRTDARTAVVADAYEMFEAERKALTSKYTTYLGRQKTKDVLSIYDTSLETGNIDAIVASHEILGFRGDFDKIGEKLQEFMDKDGYVELGSDFANTLASSLLGMKDKDPSLARLGKHINMETWRYFNESNPEERRAKTVTMKEYVTGVDSLGKDTKTGGLAKLLEGTSFKGVERTAYNTISQLAHGKNYFSSQQEVEAFETKITKTIMPQLVAAIPTFETNGEQMMNTLRYLTGLTTDKNGNWTNYDEKKNITLPVRTDMVERYLGAFTPSDLVNMKTNAFQAALKALEITYGSKDEAIRIFREIEADNIVKLRNSDAGALNGMKPSVFRALGLDMPDGKAT